MFVPVIHGHVHKAALGHLECAARVVHQYINTSKMLNKGVEHALALVAAADVALIDLCVYTVTAAFLGDALSSIRRFVVVDAHIIAFLGKRDDGGGANAVRRTGYQDRFSFAH